MTRLLFAHERAQPDYLLRAIACGLEAAKIANSDLSIVTQTKNLNTIDVGRALGMPATGKLMKGQQIVMNGIKINYQSMGTIQRAGQLRTVLAFYVDDKDLMKLDDMRMDCLIYVPFTPEQGRVWAKIWGAPYIGAPTPPSPVNLDAHVTKALEDLTRSVNLSTGLLHPIDKKDAQNMFIKLRASGFTWDPQEIEKWAVRHEWTAYGANQLAMLAR